MRADNSQHNVDAARRRSEYTQGKAIQALRWLDMAGEPVTFEIVAKRAGISRSWLYASRTCERRTAWLARSGYLVAVPGVGMVITPVSRWPEEASS